MDDARALFASLRSMQLQDTVIHRKQLPWASWCEHGAPPVLSSQGSLLNESTVSSDKIPIVSVQCTKLLFTGL